MRRKGFFLKCATPQNENSRQKCLRGPKEAMSYTLLLQRFGCIAVLVCLFLEEPAGLPSQESSPDQVQGFFNPFPSAHYSCEFSVAGCVVSENHPSAFSSQILTLVVFLLDITSWYDFLLCILAPYVETNRSFNFGGNKELAKKLWGLIPV